MEQLAAAAAAQGSDLGVGGHPLAGGGASRSEHRKRTARRPAGRPAPLTLGCALPGLGGPRRGGAWPETRSGAGGGGCDSGRRGRFFQVWERGGELKR